MNYIGFGSSKVSGVRFLPFYLFTFLLFSLSGCIEEYKADIPSEDSDLLVVEGSICSSQVNKFILTRTVPVNSTYGYTTVWGAKVSVRGTDGSEYMTESDGECRCRILPVPDGRAESRCGILSAYRGGR